LSTARFDIPVVSKELSVMRTMAAAILLLAISAAAAQSEPFAPHSVVTCPLYTAPIVDAWGRRDCISMSQKPLDQGYENLLPPSEPEHFELSNKCPQCK
jgi:hypothetical protein